MKTNSIFVAVICLLISSSALASEKAVSVLDGVFTVKNDQSVWKSETVKTLEYRPASSMYVVRGRIQYWNIEGIAYLEMWNILPDGSRYFSRTLGEYGTMQRIQGLSGWREFELPFNLMNAKPESVTLEINVVMPGKGTIELSGLTVSDIQTSVEWFSRRTGGVVGGILGGICGTFGGIIGCLSGFLVPRGKGRRLMTWLFIFAAVMGFLQLGVGLSALLLGQPGHVWYPFVLVGGLLGVIMPFSLLSVNKAYAQAELRKMQALDM